MAELGLKSPNDPSVGARVRAGSVSARTRETPEPFLGHGTSFLQRKHTIAYSRQSSNISKRVSSIKGSGGDSDDDDDDENDPIISEAAAAHRELATCGELAKRVKQKLLRKKYTRTP